ncbi:MAG: hypothetical protein KatS3mg015_2048 [Fimbriimonadales bacterium]|nr:MAG: hypothetical protein KatS3mg015_2048 [Fimbriimonadales bacterium]
MSDESDASDKSDESDKSDKSDQSEASEQWEAEIIELPFVQQDSEQSEMVAQEEEPDLEPDPRIAEVLNANRMSLQGGQHSEVATEDLDAAARLLSGEPSASVSEADEPCDVPQAHGDLGRLSEVERALLASRLVTEEQIASARRQAEEVGDTVERVLVKAGYVTDDQIAGAKASVRGLLPWDFEKMQPTQEALSKVPGAVCRRHVVLPVAVQGSLLILAVANPDDMGAIEAVRRASGMRIEPRVAGERRLREAIARYYGNDNANSTLANLVSEAEREIRGRTIRAAEGGNLTEEDTRPVVGLVNHLLTEAIRMGVSDLHIEPKENRVDVRVRLDGEMQKFHELPVSLLPMLATRLRIMADLDISDWRMPQDGRMTVHLDGRRVDVRVSVLPSLRGPRIVLRILDRALTLMALEDLGMQPTKLAMFRSMIARPYGLLLVTGPTGSGKTTTLYAALRELRQSGKNIMTCEDPVEYELEGVSQSQVNEKIGLTFAAQLRAILRQDPDVVLVGEIRDAETAQTAIRAALTGHLVLSTLHCTDAPGAIPRLLDMDVNPYLLSTSLIGVTAQRLIRTLCVECSQPAEGGPDLEMLASVVGESAVSRVRRAVGCEVCFQSGYRGRAAVHEIFPIGQAVASAIANREPLPVLRSLGAAFGYEPLQVDAIRRVLAGETTLEEARRTIAFEDLEPPSNDPLGPLPQWHGEVDIRSSGG